VEKEKALAKLILSSIKLTKEANSRRGESNKTNKEYEKAFREVCKAMDVDYEVVEGLVNPV
jgi:hypothetical protein